MQSSRPFVRIYQPAKSAMQSGQDKKLWVLEFDPDSPYYTEPLMGWNGSCDTSRQLSLRFSSKEGAVAYATRHKLDYEVTEPQPRAQIRKAYADNFKYKKAE